MAISVDDECKKKVNRTPEQLSIAQYQYTRTRKGIHPDDFERYDNGEIDGYNIDGSDIPGPNAVEETVDSNLILPENYKEIEDDE